jgi:hypothetical protein
MRLRIRSGGGETHKLALPEQCDVGTLKQRVAAALGTDAHVGLSLNKTHDLTAGVAACVTLRSCGISSGDLLFVVPACVAAAPGTPLRVFGRAGARAHPGYAGDALLRLNGQVEGSQGNRGKGFEGPPRLVP